MRKRAKPFPFNSETQTVASVDTQADTRGSKGQSYSLELPRGVWITPDDRGFRWGDLRVIRLAVLKGRLIVTVLIDRPGKDITQRVTIHATPSGRLLVYDAKGRRLKP